MLGNSFAGLYRLKTIFLVFCSVMGLAPSDSWAACDITITSLPYTVNQTNKTYCLTNNISSGTLTVSVDNVTIDGQDFSIPGDVTLDGRIGVKITRLKTNGSLSIHYGGNNEISSCTATFMDIFISRGNRLLNNTINATGTRAIMIEGDTDSKQYSRDNLIKGNIIHGSGITDARFFYMSYTFNNTFADNDVQLLNSPNLSSLRAAYYTHYNTFSHNSFKMTTATGGGNAGSYMRDQSSYNTFEFNTLNDDYRTLGTTSGNEIGSARYNLIHGNSFKGGSYVLFFQSADATNVVSYNLVQALTGQAVTTAGISDGDRIEFRNNTFISPQGDAIWSDGLSASRQYLLRNNIFITTNQPNLALPGNINLDSNYNLLSRKTAGSLIFFGNPYSTLAAWQGTGHDAQSISPATNQTIFMDEANGNYHLSASSPARNSGENGVDMGAFPYSSTSCTPDWRCGDWGNCNGNQRTRTCQDRNNCGMTQGGPATSMACVSATFSASCTPNWVCSAWGACGNVYKYRHCGDLNACEKIENMPAAFVGCSAACVPNITCTAWSACSGGTQTRTCTDSNSCSVVAGVPSPAASRKCVYSGALVGVDTIAPNAPANLQVN